MTDWYNIDMVIIGQTGIT